MTGKRQLTKANWDSWLKEFNANGGKGWEAEGIKIANELRLLK